MKLLKYPYLLYHLRHLIVEYVHIINQLLVEYVYILAHLTMKYVYLYPPSLLTCKYYPIVTLKVTQVSIAYVAIKQ
jgi:hypothetical protein